MNRYNIFINRSFAITIDAENSSAAASIAETYLGFNNESTEFEQDKYNFKIHRIDMLENEVINCDLIN